MLRDPRRIGGALAGAAGGGLGLALLDVAQLLARAPARLSFADGARLVGAGAVAGVSAGLVAGLVAAPLGSRLGRSRRRFARAPLALASAAALALADALAYPGLYPEAHALLGLAALGLAALGGALAGSRALRSSTGMALLPAAAAIAAAGSWLGPRALGSSERLRQPLLDGTTLVARVARLWPAPDAPAIATDCAWPPPAPIAASPSTGAARGDSILLISIDALRGDLGGERLARTLPGVAARLPRAFRFDRAYAPATRTAESVYGLLTGRRPHGLDFRAATVDDADRFHELDARDPTLFDPTSWKQRHLLPLHDRTPTLAGLLGAAGYRTATAIPYVFFLPAAGITREFALVDEQPYQRANRDNEGVTSELLTDRATAFLDGSDAAAPFFLWVHYMDPHAPYRPFRATSASSPAQARYLDEIARVDAAVSRLLDALAARGRLERTLVVVTADHGEEFRDHGGLYHGTSVYEEQVRVPLLLALPGRAGRAIAEPVSLLDLAPTLLDLAGVATAARFDGRSLAPLLDPAEATGGAALAERPLVAVSTLHGLRVAIVEGRYKLIEDLQGGTRELYDLEADPRERRSLADLDEQAPRLARLRCLAHALRLDEGPFPRR